MTDTRNGDTDKKIAAAPGASGSTRSRSRTGTKKAAKKTAKKAKKSGKKAAAKKKTVAKKAGKKSAKKTAKKAKASSTRKSRTRTSAPKTLSPESTASNAAALLAMPTPTAGTGDKVDSPGFVDSILSDESENFDIQNVDNKFDGNVQESAQEVVEEQQPETAVAVADEAEAEIEIEIEIEPLDVITGQHPPTVDEPRATEPETDEAAPEPTAEPEAPEAPETQAEEEVQAEEDSGADDFDTAPTDEVTVDELDMATESHEEQEDAASPQNDVHELSSIAAEAEAMMSDLIADVTAASERRTIQDPTSQMTQVVEMPDMPDIPETEDMAHTATMPLEDDGMGSYGDFDEPMDAPRDEDDYAPTTGTPSAAEALFANLICPFLIGLGVGMLVGLAV